MNWAPCTDGTFVNLDHVERIRIDKQATNTILVRCVIARHEAPLMPTLYRCTDEAEATEFVLHLLGLDTPLPDAAPALEV